MRGTCCDGWQSHSRGDHVIPAKRSVAVGRSRKSHVFLAASAVVLKACLSCVQCYASRGPFAETTSSVTAALNVPVSWWRWPDKPGEAGLGHAVASSVQGVVPLTPRAQGIERVLIVSLVGGVCTHDDWRGDLPRYFLRFLLRAQAVLLFGRDPELGWKCSTCLSEGVDQAAHGSHRESCGVYLGSGRSIKPADLLIVVGTGHFPPCAASLRQGESCDPDNRSLDRIKDQFPDIKKVFDSPYVTGDTLAIHIPIRPEPEINVGNPFPFDGIVGDSSFMKPLSRESSRALEELCHREPKSNDLLYVARYLPSKGQLQFLHQVDAGLLKGYHLHFYGSDWDNVEYHEEMEQTARLRNISVSIHRSVDKKDLFRHYCRASGHIHYAQADNNPRAAYEAITASNPLFITYSSRLPQFMHQQKFVTVLDFDDKEGFAGAFERFMWNVRDQRQLEPQIKSFVKANLSPTAVYLRLCIEIGVCRPEAANLIHELVDEQLPGQTAGADLSSV